jgi:hypothetical protein
MAVPAVGREQLRAGFALVEILRSRKSAGQRQDENDERMQSAPERRHGPPAGCPHNNSRIRHCEAPEGRSNPERLAQAALDCFVASLLAMTASIGDLPPVMLFKICRGRCSNRGKPTNQVERCEIAGHSSISAARVAPIARERGYQSITLWTHACSRRHGTSMSARASACDQASRSATSARMSSASTGIWRCRLQHVRRKPRRTIPRNQSDQTDPIQSPTSS